MEVVDGGGGGGGGGGRVVVRLRCSVNNYDWGRIGSESGVARLYSLNSGALIDESKPYAEFWMGTHDSGPSFVVVDGGGGVQNGGGTAAANGGNVTLKAWIAKNPKVLGDKVVEKWGNNLPFLFKVLSVAKALSIQAHPDKKLAEVLHELEPNVYKDDNHKPEMVLALTEFEALCGFISFKELKGVLQDVPEIEEVVGAAYVNQVLLVDEQDDEEKVKAVLRSLFTQLMAASKEVVSYVLSKLISRLNKENKSRQLTVKEELALRLEKQYPDDVGVIAAFLFNYVKLNPGEALFLGANELHAYLYGECVECMATSDNVVRAGLTPKDRDVKILTSMLTYKQSYPEILQGDFLNPHTKRYTSPFEEFEVDSCILDQGETVDFPAFPGPSIYVVIMGHGAMHTTSSKEEVWEGDVFFAPAGTAITLSTESMLHLCRAGVNSSFFLG